MERFARQLEAPRGVLPTRVIDDGRHGETDRLVGPQRLANRLGQEVRRETLATPAVREQVVLHARPFRPVCQFVASKESTGSAPGND